MVHELHRILYGSVDCAPHTPGRRVSSIFKQPDINQNISDEQKVISLLATEGSATIREICMALGMPQRTIKMALDRMHNAKLVVAVIGDGDRDPLEYSLCCRAIKRISK